MKPRAVGGKFGAYTVIGYIDGGAGGFGRTYKAHDADGNVVAIKQPYANQFDLRQWTREIEALKAASGPHLARAYASSYDPADPWLAMEFVNLPTLSQRIKTEGSPSHEEFSQFALLLAKGLEDLARIVHGAVV